MCQSDTQRQSDTELQSDTDRRSEIDCQSSTERQTNIERPSCLFYRASVIVGAAAVHGGDGDGAPALRSGAGVPTTGKRPSRWAVVYYDLAQLRLSGG